MDGDGCGQGEKPDDERRLWQLECGCGSCRLILRLTAYIVSAVVVIDLVQSPREILWWEEVDEPLSLVAQMQLDSAYHALPLPPGLTSDRTTPERENGTTPARAVSQAGRLCFLISKGPLKWSDDALDALNGKANLFDTNAVINLGVISGGTTRDYCGFSLDEVIEASFMVATIMGLEENSSLVDVRPCLTPLYCRRPISERQDACLTHRTDPSCYDACYTEEYKWSLLLTLVNESESLPWARDGLRRLGMADTGENETQGSKETAFGCEEREKFLNEIFFEVPADRLKVAAFINFFRFEATKEAMKYKTIGGVLVAAVGLTGILWFVQLCNFLYHQYKDDDDELGCGEWLSRKILTSTLILVTWLFPLALLRPLCGAQVMPEPLSDTILMATPSLFSDMLVGILVIMVFAVPLMCCGGCCVAAHRSCLAVCTWMLALVLCTSAAALIGRSYFFDGFFLYVDFSMVFSFNFKWEISMLVDLIQLLFFFSFLLELASVITFITGYVRKHLRRCMDYKGQLKERCSTAKLPVGVRQSEASDGNDLEHHRQDEREEVSHPKQDVDPKDPCPGLEREASNQEDEIVSPEDSCTRPPEEQEIRAMDTSEQLEDLEGDSVHQGIAAKPDVTSP